MKKFFGLLSLLIFTGLLAQAQMVTPVTWEGSVKLLSAEEAEIQITATMQKDWVLYAVDDGNRVRNDFSIPLQIKFSPSENYQLMGKMQLPKAQNEYDDVMKCTNYFYKGKAVFLQKIKIKAEKDFLISCHISGQSCTDGRCVLEDENLKIEVKGFSRQEKELAQNDQKTSAVSNDGENAEGEEKMQLQDSREEVSAPTKPNSKMSLFWLIASCVAVASIGLFLALYFVFGKKATRKRKASSPVPDGGAKAQGKAANGYVLIRQLGRGGMAEVWYAENKIHKPAAVKILLPQFCSEQEVAERFRKEADVMVRLNHPNIRHVYDYDEMDGRPCIVMEYLEGDDLGLRMKNGETFSKKQLRQWWNQMVSALNYVHAQGVIHRDLKPSNIFIDRAGNVKLLDFGIAKVNDGGGKTQTGAMMGTLMYMSPEQVMDAKHLDYKTDLYSLAVTFVHLLTGQKPYDMDSISDYQVRKCIVEEPLRIDMLPHIWLQLLAPYLAKNPADRPALVELDPSDDAEDTVSGASASRPSPISDENTICG